MIYTGPIDEYFDYRFGKLPYRSLRFEHVTVDEAQAQPVAVVNYPNEHLYTRVTEFKHLTGQEHPQHAASSTSTRPRRAIRTTRCRDAENAELYKRYEALAAQTPGVHFVGRLATYQYYNMDQVVAQALTLYRKLAQGAAGTRSAGARLSELVTRTRAEVRADDSAVAGATA